MRKVAFAEAQAVDSIKDIGLPNPIFPQ
jgi:hypothetical protein